MPRCSIYIMTMHTFYQKFDQSTSFIQNLAFKLTKDIDMARLLYLETAHLAMKNRAALQEENFEQWLSKTMKVYYNQLISRSVN